MISVESSGEPGVRSEAVVLSIWADRHAAAMLAATILVAATGMGLPIAAAGAASFVLLWLRARPELARAAPLGSCADALTALRLALVLAAAALVARLPAGWLVAALGANVLLDVVDGRIARHRKETSSFGAVFDREADAVFVLVCYTYFFSVEGFPGWVLLLGALPYAYRLGMGYVLRLRESEDRQPIAAFLAGCNYLILLVAMVVPDPIRLSLVVLSAAIVGSSFLISLAKRLRRESLVS